MAIRNCAEVGENLQKIVSRLMANDNLIKLLYYTNNDPLSQVALTDSQKMDYVFNKLIKIVPKVTEDETSRSIVSIRVTDLLNMDNTEFQSVEIGIELFCPLSQWVIKDTNLRPFAIMGEIEKSLKNKTINGLGKFECGDIHLQFLTDTTGSYILLGRIVTYD